MHTFPSITIVMTATVTPPQGTPQLARSDPKVRLKDYFDSLAFYLSLPDTLVHKVLFIDNSNTNLDKLKSINLSTPHNKQVEFISFQGNDHPPEYGKGYGELRLLDYGLSTSQIISASDIIWKVTGRLRILNLEKLIKTAPKDYDIYCDLRDVPLVGNSLGGNQWMDMRIFSFGIESYNNFFKGEYVNVRKDICHGSPEQYFFRKLKDSKNLNLVPRFKQQPIIEGFGGRLNVDYRKGLYRVKEIFRAIMRKATPFIWF